MHLLEEDVGEREGASLLEIEGGRTKDVKGRMG